MKKKVLEYFNGDSLASDVFLSKYSLNKKETPDDMHKRLAKEFARIEWYYLHLKALILIVLISSSTSLVSADLIPFFFSFAVILFTSVSMFWGGIYPAS